MKKRVKEKPKKLEKPKKTKRNKFLFWTPRILTILFLLFLALFSLDVFEGNYGFWGTILALFMHNIPVFILLAVFLIFWKKGIVPGILFITAGILYTIICIVRFVMSSPREWYMLSWSLIIPAPAFIIGILYILDWRKNK